MADKKIMVDSTILIDYFRKTDKVNSKLVSHFKNYEQLYISSVTEFRLLTVQHKHIYSFGTVC